MEGPRKLSQCTPKPSLLPEACPPVTSVGNCPQLPGVPISSPTQTPLCPGCPGPDSRLQELATPTRVCPGQSSSLFTGSY